MVPKMASELTACPDTSPSISGHNFASDDLVFCSTQVVIFATNASTSSLVLPACKHTRIRSEPSGTVGGTIGLTMKFFSWQNLARPRGSELSTENIGDGGHSSSTCRRWR
jgi:hypothetical protein